MVYKKAFLNGKDITKYIRSIELDEKNNIIKNYSLLLITSLKTKDFVLSRLSDGDGIPNFLYIKYYDKEEIIDRDSYSFVTEDVHVNEDFDKVKIFISFSLKNEILEYVNKIEKLEDKIQELKEKNFELKEEIYKLEEITEKEVVLPPRIPIGESSSKEDIKQKKDFMDIFFHIALISSWFVLLDKCLLGV